MLCSQCGKEITDGSRFCPGCGAESAAPVQQPKPSPSTAEGTRDQTARSDLVYPKNPPLSPYLALLTFLCTGLPHIFFGQIVKGVIWLVIAIVAFFALPCVGIIAVDVVAIIDCYLVGKKLASGKPVGKMEWFPGT